ncbi:uncharacterized protein KGF55_001016 [Candida pseudojiufengensis]|uniref:uncharacterized protein n=1 Tax=Candida pseudojiufengensis TaxID=497109 RepID=UPI0022259507|nr:uncharacterized protein KGF55_001016 [Candida pseudojiufengensis]KAI5965654.1 hypothetical protein KGF55_001016 [Candida pseudojiufengensis]
MNKFKAPSNSKFNKRVNTIDPIANLSKYVGSDNTSHNSVQNGSLKEENCAFYPIQQYPNDNSIKENTFQKQSRFSRFLYKFKHRPSISFKEPKKVKEKETRAKTLALGVGGNIVSHTWIRRFSKTNNTMATPIIIASSPIEQEPKDIFSPPPSEIPMETIDSVQNDNINQENKFNSLPLASKLTPTTRSNKSKSFSLNTFYNNSFFKTGGRLPISYDNSQITDETIINN